MQLHSYEEDTICFYTVDEHAKKASLSDSSTFDSLIAYLRKPIVNNENSELLLARAIVVWMCHVQSTDLSFADRASPRGLIMQMKERSAENSRVFKTFCGYAEIECEIIEGRAKAIRYQAGDTDCDYIRNHHTWNAFRSGGKWHLIHPQWCIHAYIGFVHGGDFIIEDDGKNDIKQRVRKEGISRYSFNDFWFCTHPEIFVKRCLPNDSKWQCLPKDRMVKSVEEFLSMPDLRQGYFSHNLTLIGWSSKSCVLHVNNGKCHIDFLSDRNKGKELQFSYELLAANVDSLNVKNLPRLVFFTPNQPPDNFTFDVSLPSAGDYRLKIRVGLKGQKILIGCCEFKINCTAGDPNCTKLPIDTGIQGWGFGPDAEDVGLKEPSEVGAKIQLPQADMCDEEQVLVEFRVDADEMESNFYSADIHSCSSSSSVTEKPAVKLDKEKRRLSVQAKNLDGLQQSALVISCREKHEPSSSSRPVVSYILTSESESEDKASKDTLNQERKQARQQQKLNQALEKNKLLKSNMEVLLERIADNDFCVD